MPNASRNGVASYLNGTVWCKLAPSPIHGIGVFAIRDIPKHTLLANYESDNLLWVCDEKEFERIIPEIREILIQRNTFRKDKELYFYSPNINQTLQSFMNHSNTPNSDGRYSMEYIKKGEEITENFFTIGKDHHEITINRNNQLK